MTAVPKPTRQEKEPKRLERRTPLRAKTPLTSKTRLETHTPLKARSAKGAARARALSARSRAMKTGVCQICGAELGAENTCFHHIVFRSQGGSDAPENLIEVGCGVPWKCDCHGAIHRGEISLAEVLAAKEKAKEVI